MKVVASAAHDCARDGHMIAWRFRPDGDALRLVPFCEVCRLLGLPAPITLVGSMAGELVRVEEQARRMEEAPLEAYEALFADEEVPSD